MPAAIVVLFDIGHSEEARHRLKTCQKCQVIYHYSHYTKPNETFVDGSRAHFFYEDSLDSDYFLASSSSGFSVRFLRTYFSEIFLVPEMSFYAKEKSYNMSVSSGNVAMERRTLADCFFTYALISMLRTYYKPIANLKFGADVDKNIDFYLCHLKSGFNALSAKRRCNVAGCGTCVGWDADCKV